MGARPGASVELVVLDLTRWLRPESGGGVDDSHLQQPVGAAAVAAAAVAAAAAEEVPAVFRLLSVSVRVGSVVTEE